MNLLIIGGGSNSAVGRVHRDAISLANSNFKVIDGVFSRSQTINRASHEMWGLDCSSYYPDYLQMLKSYSDSASDYVVLILTPTPCHYQQISDAIGLGFAVICEKSLTSSVNDLQKLEDQISLTNAFLRTTFNYSGYPLVREARALITEGFIGNVHQIVLEMPQEGLVRPPLIQGEYKPPQQWRLQDEAIPTVCLDLGVHLHHLLKYLTSCNPDPVSCVFYNHTQYKNIVDTLFCNFLDLQSNLTGSMWFTKSAIGTRNGLNFRVFGSAGSLYWYQQEPEKLHLALSTGELKIIDRASSCVVANLPRYERMKAGHPSGFIEAFANIYDDIYSDYTDWRNSLVPSDPTLLSLNHSLAGLKFFDKCLTLNSQVI